MKIVYVNGYKIRQSLDVDFGIIHRHELNPTQYAPKFYIPRDEIWIDHRFRQEKEFLLTNLKKGSVWFGGKSKSKKSAGRRYIDQMRGVPAMLNKNRPPAEVFVMKEESSGGVKIKYVDGSVVRRHFDPGFILGGHDFVYSYIPRGEIWIDNLLDSRDLPHLLVHETVERKLMAKEGKIYDVAHDYATAEELESRREAGGIYLSDVVFPRVRDWKKLIREYYI